MELSKHFENVYASDISENQLAQATQLPNIHYSVERAESTRFQDNQFDLITVGQAVHWFDFDAFNKEVHRVAKNDAILCVWGYGLFKMDKAINELVNEFYHGIIGPYWNKERMYIDEQYASIPFEFKEIAIDQKREIVVNWNLDELKGYFNSWSSVQHYKDANEGQNPVDDLMGRISQSWIGATKEIRFPLFMRMGRINK